MFYHLRKGDLLHNPDNGALGLITKITKGYFYFHLMSYDVEEQKNFLISEDRASKRKVYESIDNNVIMVYYGTGRRRRKRKTFYQNIEVKQENSLIDEEERKLG